jgi:hypothetical protein
MLADGSADFPLLVSRNAAREAVGEALRLFVGRGKRFSVKQLANGTGVKDRVIECAMARPDDPDCRPLKICELLSIASFLGPVFTSEIIKLAMQGAFTLPDTDDTPPGEIAADNSDDNATLTRAALDGEFDDVERPVLRVVGKRMMVRGAALAALPLRAHG